MSEDTHIVEEGLDTSYQSTPSENPPILVAEAVQEPTAPSQKSDLPPLLAKVDGHVHVLGFSMRERRIFYETVMRLGAPPEDAYNSPWRTSCLNHKSQKEFNVYSSLFLRHAAEPSPEHSEFFVDGVPREGLNRQNVLTRMAIMSLIRKKVKEFEDLNSDWSVQEDHEKLLADRRAALKASQVHQSQALEKKGEAGSQLIIAEASQDFTAPKLHKPTPVQFNIAEGGFLELHKLWALEEEALMEGKEYEVWNRRHDYWLLAGIVQHGYGRYRDIVSDVRFAIIVKPSSLDEAFFEHRFKLLEQALIIEEQLRRINLLSLGDISTKNTLQLRKLFLQLQDVVAEARNDVCRQPTLLNSIPKGIPLRSILSASITPPGPYEADSFDDTSSNQPYHNSRPKFVAILAGKVTKVGP